jgi:hypothetical protein
MKTKKQLIADNELPKDFFKTHEYPPKCFRCGTVEDLEYGPDPYNGDVNNNPTPVWECGYCREQSAGDI